MKTDTTAAVGPHLFLGGAPSDYTVGVGPSGTYHSRHRATGKAIQSVMPQAGEAAGRVMEGLQLANVVGVANLGVGLLNLGVGIYNAHQLAQVREGLGRVEQKLDGVRGDLIGVRDDVRTLGRLTQQSFSLVVRMLQDHGVALGVLIDGQMALAERLEYLRLEIRAGFTDLRHGLLAAEARRVRQELEARAGVAARHYRVLHDCLSRGTLPSPLELRSVVDSGTLLLAWLDTMLTSTEAAGPARLPLLALKTAGIRMVCDARSLERSDHPTESREKAELAQEIADAALAFCDSRSPWDLANGCAQLVAGYVFLHRGLTHHTDLGIGPNGELVPLLPAAAYTWSDGLEALRPSVDDAVDTRLALDEPLALYTPDDLRWLAQWQHETGSPAVPSPRSVLGVVGAESPQPVSAAVLRQLRGYALAEGRRRVSTSLEREFGWQQAPRVLPGTPSSPFHDTSGKEED